MGSEWRDYRTGELISARRAKSLIAVWVFAGFLIPAIPAIAVGVITGSRVATAITYGVGFVVIAAGWMPNFMQRTGAGYLSWIYRAGIVVLMIPATADLASRQDIDPWLRWLSLSAGAFICWIGWRRSEFAWQQDDRQAHNALPDQ